jgi:beta-glucosidase
MTDIDALLSRMTLPEKLAQLGAVRSQVLLKNGELDPEAARTLLANGAGHITRVSGASVLGPAGNARSINQIQRHLREHTRLAIPAIIHEETCSGLLAVGATQFPQALGLAASFEPELVQRMAEVIREQTRAIGARLSLAPVLDVARDPRWGRCEETFGEDPFLIGLLGAAYVRGLQGPDLSRGVVATAKHFMGYGVPDGGRNWGPCSLGTRELLDRILPPFEAAVRAGIGAVMNGYQEIDGVPCGASRWLLTDILRDRLGFEGTVVADYYTVSCLLTLHHIASTPEEAGMRALEAGLDVELPETMGYGEALVRAIEAGRFDVKHVDRSVRRVLEQKRALGLFEDPFVDEGAAAAVYDTPADRALAREAAQKSVVLLKNDGELLPLSPSCKRIAVIGPNADSVRALYGDYNFPNHVEGVFGSIRDPGHPDVEAMEVSPLSPNAQAEPIDLLQHTLPSVTVLEGVRAAVRGGCEVSFALGCTITGPSEDGFAEAVHAARGADAAIVVVGGRSGLTRGSTVGESRDSTNLNLTGRQAALVRAVAATGTPVVLVVMSGRVHTLSNVVNAARAVLYAFCPGEEGGHGLSDVLFGKVEPTARLPITLPRTVGQLPVHYNHKPTGNISIWHGNYTDSVVSPLFPFGFGMGYTRFEYSALELSAREVGADDVVKASFTLRNVGARAGAELVQLYARDPLASVTRPVKELKAFERVTLAPGESRRVTLELPVRELAFHDLNLRKVIEPGAIDVLVGSNSADLPLEAQFQIRGPLSVVG